MSELCVILGVFVCVGVLVAKKYIMSFCMELSVCPALGNTSFLCYCHVLAQGLMLPSAVKAGFWHGGFSGGGHRIGQRREWRGNLRGNGSFFQMLIVPRIKILCFAACLANQSCVDSNSKCIFAFLFLPYCKNCLRLEV